MYFDKFKEKSDYIHCYFSLETNVFKTRDLRLSKGQCDLWLEIWVENPIENTDFPEKVVYLSRKFYQKSTFPESCEKKSPKFFFAEKKVGREKKSALNYNIGFSIPDHVPYCGYKGIACTKKNSRFGQ